MKKFYIFLDLDGVLNSYDYFDKCYKRKSANPNWQVPFLSYENVDNLNALVREIERAYIVKFAISSAWRKDIDYAYEILSDSRLKFDGELINIDNLSIHRENESRGSKIMRMLDELNWREKSTETDNFIVLDDESFRIFPDVPEKNAIITNKQTGLTFPDIKKYLEANQGRFEYKTPEQGD